MAAMKTDFLSAKHDVIVCGAGHAGVEASLAAARMGARTLLLTGSLDTIGQMSCNPAIGGQAKGQMVREVDALGGEMAVNTDRTAIQFRLLNESKGAAVQSPRAQSDKKAYQQRLKHVLERQRNLEVFQATVTGLERGRDATGPVTGVRTALGVAFRAACVVVTTGTFLRGLLHVGDSRQEGGRMGDSVARDLSGSLQATGIELRRFKTGTPPRVLGRSLDFSRMKEQAGDDPPTTFAFWDTRDRHALFHVEHPARAEARSGGLFHVEHEEPELGWEPNAHRRSCWITYTSEETARLVRANLGRSALYGGRIEGVGPRYCPSIEDKFVKFADKPRHMLFLEPEGRHTNEFYINGLSTSLPVDVQMALVRSIPGLEDAQLLRPAYAVEYDYAPPTQLEPWLESRVVPHLFFAGQINGTSGYEEAAAQGLVAGANAALRARGEAPWIPGRQCGYLGVLIDDLVTKGVDEPYRMFTSRAEHRLLFNHGSAEIRLLDAAVRLGLVEEGRLARMRAKRDRVTLWTGELERVRVGGLTAAEWVRRDERCEFPSGFLALSPQEREEVLYRVRYRGYLEREERLLQRLENLDAIRIPDDLNPLEIRGLRLEAKQKLDRLRPRTLGQASRVSGISPADLQVLLIAVEAVRRRGGSSEKDSRLE